MVKGSNRLSPAAAMSLNRGCEERPSRRKEGWEVGTEGAGAGAGPPGRRGHNTQGFLFTFVGSMLQEQVGHHIHTRVANTSLYQDPAVL